MTLLLHVRRNLARNKVRTISLIVVVGLSLGIFFIMGDVGSSVTANSGQVLASVPNIVTVLPANESIGGGYFSLTVGNSPTGLDSSAIRTVSSTPNVVSVQRLYAQPLELSSLGSGSGFVCGSASNPQVLAEDTTSSVKYIFGLSGASAVTITSGRNLGPTDENGLSAIVSQQYATVDHLSVGSTLNVDGHAFEVVGVFSQSCYTMILPYPAAAAALNVTQATILYATVNQYLNVNGVVSSLQTRLGSSYSVEYLANADRNSLQSSISSILSGSQFAEYAVLISGALVMGVVTVFVNSRRTKEVGLLKTLGYGNGRILGQTLLESLVISLLGFPVAALVTIAVGPIIAQLLLGQIGSPNTLVTPPTGGGTVAGSGAGANPFLQNLHFSLSQGTLVLGIEIALTIGVLSAAIPAIDALLLRPSEALRHE